MWLWELHAGHTHPHLFPKIPPQITSSKAYQTTTCTRKSSANPVRIKNPSRKERHVAGDIRVKNQAHSRRVRYICVVWTSSKPDNGNQTKLNWITSIKGHRKLGKRSKIFFWLLCYSPKYREFLSLPDIIPGDVSFFSTWIFAPYWIGAAFGGACCGLVGFEC